MTLAAKPPSGKMCFVYCGPERCDCGRGRPSNLSIRGADAMTHPMLTEEMVEEMQAAVEGECNGLAIDKTTARNILAHVLPLIGEAMAKENQEWRRTPQFQQGYRTAIKDAVTWLHLRAVEMNDWRAKAWCNSAAFSLGGDAKRGRLQLAIRSATQEKANG